MLSERETASANISTVLREGMRDALLAAMRGGTASAPRALVRNVLTTAPGGRREPEHSLITFKALLTVAANDAGIPLGRDRAALLERFVTLFIEEMYGAESQYGLNDLDRVGSEIGAQDSTGRESPAARS